MHRRAILLIVPSLALSIVGVAMFGPGSARPFVAVELWGGPLGGSGRISLRAMSIERLRGIDSAVDVGQLLVRLSGIDDVLGEARCFTDANGACDVNFQLSSRVTARVHATVYTLSDGREVASGDLADALGWGAEGAHSAHLIGTRAGYPALSVIARRGVFVAPFRDDVAVEAAPALPLRIRANAAGAELIPGVDVLHAEATGSFRPEANGGPDAGGRDEHGGEVMLDTRPSHPTLLGVVPGAHAVELDVRATREGSETRWTGSLPVVPGAMWLDPVPGAEGTRRVVSAVPRSIAYATVASAERRWWGGAVALRADAQGFASGTLILPPDVEAGEAPRWLTLASDPRGTGSGTVGWPLAPERTPEAQREWAFRDHRLLDGMPAAERRDQERRGRARTLAWLALATAACVESALLAQVAGRAGGRRGWVRLAIALATVLLAFTAVGMIVLWKTSS